MSVHFICVLFAILAVILALSARQAMHGLLYLLVGLLAISVDLSLFGSAYGAVLLMIVYAGAIMVLFVFVVMLLNRTPSQFQITLVSLVRQFFGPLLLAVGVFSLLVFAQGSEVALAPEAQEPFSIKAVAEALFRDGWFFVELISLLLTAALIGAFHIGKRHEP